MIPITQPFLPKKDEYQKYINEIWENNWLTNNGPNVRQLEDRLAKYLKIKEMLLVNNGTIALQLAIKVLGMKRKVITTPFSYVATTSSLVWEGCEPIFVDIDPDSLNIDPERVEEALGHGVDGILATHCFGNPCDVESLEFLSESRGKKLIFDAAHGFGSKYKDKSLFEYGDISISSFHSTKLYHTIEGGGIFSKDERWLEKVAFMRNFGHDGSEKFQGIGINGKVSEFHAAMGLVNLNYIDEILLDRKKLSVFYDTLLQHSGVRRPIVSSAGESNFSYYPIIFESERVLLEVKKRLEESDIFPRRYFYPALNSLDYVKSQSCPIAEDISKRILCLPMYYGLTESDQEKIAEILLKAL